MPSKLDLLDEEDAQVIREVSREYLESLGCTLWGRSFDIIERNSLDQASEWAAELFCEILTRVGERE